MRIIVCMPTVFKIWGLKVRIYPKDHGAPHVHIIGDNAEAKIEIGTQAVIRSRGFSARTLSKLQTLVADNGKEWMRIYEEYQE